MPERLDRLVLIIDDDADIARLIRVMLSPYVARVLVETDPLEALNAARAARPDLILCDVSMPGVTGFDIRRQIAAEPSLNDVPFIFVSGVSTPDVQTQAFRLGATGYVTKPIHKDTLVSAVLTQLERKNTFSSVPAIQKSAAGQLAGRLDVVPIADLMQLLEASKSSGVLTVQTRAINGEMVFSKGRLVAARTNNWSGEDAALRILWMKEGNFGFEKRDISESAIMPGWSIGKLLIDAAWLHDELARLGDKAPGVGDSVVVENYKIMQEYFPDREKWFELYEEKSALRVDQLAQRLGMSTYRCRALLGGAAEKGAVKILPPGAVAG